MFVDIVIDKETLLTINTKSVEFLLKTADDTQFPIRFDDKEIIIKFRKEIA